MISNDQAQQFIRALLRQPPKVVAQTKQEDPLGIFEKAPRATYGRELNTSDDSGGGSVGQGFGTVGTGKPSYGPSILEQQKFPSGPISNPKGSIFGTTP